MVSSVSWLGISSPGYFMDEGAEEHILNLIHLEEMLSYAYARASVLHRVKAQEYRKLLERE